MFKSFGNYCLLPLADIEQLITLNLYCFGKFTGWRFPVDLPLNHSREIADPEICCSYSVEIYSVLV
jgi:hypothetical protein